MHRGLNVIHTQIQTEIQKRTHTDVVPNIIYIKGNKNL